MHPTPLPDGQQVFVDSFGENPLEAIGHNMRIAQVRAPDPAALKPHEIVLRIQSASVNRVDLLMTSGQYQKMPSPPYTPGLEYSGRVVATGSAVSRVSVGDAVLVDGMQAGARSGGNYQTQGGYAPYAVLPESALRRIPKGLSFDEACCLLGNFETAYYSLVQRARLQAGETVLIHGASGSIGLAAVQVAKLLGATVIATGRSDEKLAIVKAQGADHVLNTTAPAGETGVRRFRDEVKALTDGKGVHVVYDGVGGETSIESMRCVRFGARFLIVAWTSTPDVANGHGQRGSPRANQLPTNLMMMKGLNVLGCPTVISTENNPALRPPRLEQLMQWAATGRIRPRIANSYPLANFREAMLATWHSQAPGTCVLHPWDDGNAKP